MLLASSTVAGVAGVDEQVLVARREPVPQLPALGVEVDDDLGEEVGLAEHLVHQQPQVRRLVVVDADEDRAPVGQHLARGLQPRPHHRDPRLVPAPPAVAEVVGVGEVVAGVVRRVDVDQVDLPESAASVGSTSRLSPSMNVFHGWSATRRP